MKRKHDFPNFPILGLAFATKQVNQSLAAVNHGNIYTV